MNFGVVDYDDESGREVKDHIKKFVEQKLSPLASALESLQKETKLTFKHHDEQISSKADKLLLAEVQD